jgi:hypothetical protein
MLLPEPTGEALRMICPAQLMTCTWPNASVHLPILWRRLDFA